jgi:hypothetical protein
MLAHDVRECNGATQQDGAPAAGVRRIFADGPCNGLQGSYVFWMTYAAEAAGSRLKSVML